MKGESQAHKLLKQMAITRLIQSGYIVREEHFIIIGKRKFRVDVVGFKKNESVAIECGKTKYSKIEKLRTYFTYVERIMYSMLVSPKREAEAKRKLGQKVWISTLHKSHQTQVPKGVISHLKFEVGSQIVWIRDGTKIIVDSPKLK